MCIEMADFSALEKYLFVYGSLLQKEIGAFNNDDVPLENRQWKYP